MNAINKQPALSYADTSGVKPRLAMIFAVSASVCWAFSLFGPFAWKVYDGLGILYFIMIEFALLLGLCLGNVRIGKSITRNREALSQQQVGFLLITSAMSVVVNARLN